MFGDAKNQIKLLYAYVSFLLSSTAGKGVIKGGLHQVLMKSVNTNDKVRNV